MHVTFSQLTKTHKTLLIICLFTILGALTLLIKNIAEEAQYTEAKLFNTAIHAQSTDAFNYAVDSQQGNILTYGTFTTPEPVTIPEVTGNYFRITKTEERYTQHTQYYECGTTENPRTCTRTYYTWDYRDYDNTTASTLTFHERNYPSNIFSIPYARRLTCENIINHCKSGYQYEDNNSLWTFEGDLRWYYTVTDTTFSGSIFVNTTQGLFAPVNESLISIQNQTVEDRIKQANNTTYITITIIALFIINLGICIVLFKENVIDQ